MFGNICLVILSVFLYSSHNKKAFFREGLMRKMEHRVKSFTAMLLSMCLLLPQGALNVWAANAVPEAAAAAAMTGEAAAAYTASASDA